MNIADFAKKVFSHMNLEPDLDDFGKIHESIKKDIVFKGTNLWILMFAIVVASIGLNMNSTAVIIGAMLISPLMGPIIGVGYSLATYNFPLLRHAVKNFTFAVLISLVASTAYFLFSPISTAHSELLARTSPTIYDVLIALFGGLAGIVATSSRLKGNVIPGVAIATALMPPLCTAGYGLATLQIHFFLGAIYLFTINAVFIALAAVVVSQILKFPIDAVLSPLQKKRINQWISFTIVLVLFPSIYFGYKLISKEKFNEDANRFIRQVSFIDGNFLLKSEINPNNKTISLVYGGTALSEEQKQKIMNSIPQNLLEETQVSVLSGFSSDSVKTNEMDLLKTELSRMSGEIAIKNRQIDSLLSKPYRGKTILDEISIIYPEITGCSYSTTYQFQTSDTVSKPIELFIFETKKNQLAKDEKSKIELWLKERLNSDNIKVYYQN